MFKIAVCDDQNEICTRVENALLSYQDQCDIPLDIEVFYSANELFTHLKQGESFDLVFLDIEIPGMNGIELGDNIRNYMDDFRTKIVFISCCEMYYRELFEVQPLHFLLKPFSDEAVIKDLRLALRLAGLDRADFEYCVARERYRLPIKEILHFQSEGRRMVLTTADDCARFYATIDEVFEKVKNHRFIRIHRAFIVNYDYITRICADSLTMSDGTQFSIARSYRDGFKKAAREFERERMV